MRTVLQLFVSIEHLVITGRKGGESVFVEIDIFYIITPLACRGMNNYNEQSVEHL